jgi:peptidoglycan/xylan/chitin deacetylase (PgdA/CDA1 family)
VATHTQNHPLSRMSPLSAVQEIESGIASVGHALGPRRQVAPFFRFPGLYRTGAAETYLRRRSLMVWSVDVDSYDWKRNTTEQMLAGTMARLEARRGGILLMHDIKPKTARALPRLIAMLKARGFRVVHVVPASGALPVPPLMSSTPAPRDFDVTFTSAVPR